jgi:hypothetical protein
MWMRETCVAKILSDTERPFPEFQKQEEGYVENLIGSFDTLHSSE